MVLAYSKYMDGRTACDPETMVATVYGVRRSRPVPRVVWQGTKRHEGVEKLFEVKEERS